MKTPLLLSAVLLLNSCSFLNWNSSNQRELASMPLRSMTSDASPSFAEEIDTKLESLHVYYMLGNQYLSDFDALIEDTPIEELYQTEAYLKLQAVRIHAEEIEHEIGQTFEDLQAVGMPKNLKLNGYTVVDRIYKFSEKSSLTLKSLENIRDDLNLVTPEIQGKTIKTQDVATEMRVIQGTTEFQVYEKNIEHTAYMLKHSMEAAAKQFYPSTGKAGNITGNEFPEKVWSLTFDDGPNNTTTGTILKSLQDKKLKATFFQLSSMAKNKLNRSMGKKLVDAGMEIASHSYSHKQLTKVGAQTLDREITGAIRDLKFVTGKNIRFFRLPYGAGVSSSNVRQKIADNDTIHVFWNIDTLDWMAQSPEKIVSRTLSMMKKTKNDAGILLFHDIHARTAQAVPQIMDYLNKNERRVCTLGEIVDQMNEGVKTVCPKE